MKKRCAAVFVVVACLFAWGFLSVRHLSFILHSCHLEQKQFNKVYSCPLIFLGSHSNFPFSALRVSDKVQIFYISGILFTFDILNCWNWVWHCIPCKGHSTAWPPPIPKFSTQMQVLLICRGGEKIYDQISRCCIPSPWIAPTSRSSSMPPKNTSLHPRDPSASPCVI